MKDFPSLPVRPHAASPADIVFQLKTDATAGLQEENAVRRLHHYGPNISPESQKEGVVSVFIRQFKSAVMALLAGASLIAFILGDKAEAVAILGVVLINAGMGFVLEMQAIRSMDALKKLDVSTARVIRGGSLIQVPSPEIVPGDMIYLEAGDRIPADARLVECSLFQADESALTGESLPVNKKTDPVASDSHPGDRLCMVFKGTSAVKGNAKAVVTATGSSTEFGKISGLVQSAVHAATPLEKKLEALTKKLILITAFLAGAFLISGLLRGNDLYLMIETAIALSVAAIPEGLPVVATIALAYGMMRMAEKNVIVKKLSAVETLGGTNIILTDKTGTLTMNRMDVTELSLPAGKTEWIPERNLRSTAENALLSSENFKQLLRTAILCNNASLTVDSGMEKFSGDPMEVSLLRFALQAGEDIEKIRSFFSRKAEDPFTPETRVMGTLHFSGSKFFIAAKGAPEELLARCTHFFCDGKPEAITPALRQHWLAKAEKMSLYGLRTLAFACLENTEYQNEFTRNLTFLGIAGFVDPPRPEVLPAMQSCREAGIRVVMVTGDHPATALYIARKSGIEAGRAVTGKELKDPEQLSVSEKKELLLENVFARVTPEQKLKLVSLFQENGSVVGMTGDGVNDAPALKKSDIGIAMGVRGTQVAQETADMVLRDDSFVSIASAVEQGRIIFRNIRSFILYLMSCNLAEIFIVAFAGILDLSLPLLPLQILFLNLVTDVFPALALGMGKGSGKVMQEPPRNPRDPIIGTREWRAVLIYALIMTLTVLGAFFYCHFVLKLEDAFCNNVAFFTIALAQLFHVFNLAPASSSFFNNEVTRNVHVWLALGFCMLILAAIRWVPEVNVLLAIQPVSGAMLALILAGSLMPVFFIQLLKKIQIVI